MRWEKINNSHFLIDPGVELLKAGYRSWLALRPVTAEVAGSSPFRVAKVLVSYLYMADIRTLFGLITQLVRAND